jgi:outer membrane receptor for ferrienterochelin and colicin
MYRSLVLTLAANLIAVSALFAQGSIAGTVTDGKTGEPIIGANVIIPGTQTGVATDIDGKFLLSNVKAGTYNLQVSFITYKTHMIPDVVVENGKRITLTVPLHEDVTELQEIVVTGTRQVDTDYDLVRSIKEAKLVVVGISAQQISRTLDRDAAQVMRRVPGVTIRNNEFVQVRGLNERYNAVMLHDAYAPSVETDQRSFSFALIPSSQLDRMLVFKSPAADIPGDFAGGVIKVYTKSIPDENGLEVNYTTQFRSGTTFNDFYSQQKNRNHFTGFNTGYYDLPAYFPADVDKVSTERQIQAGRSFKNLWAAQKGTAMPDQRVGITFSRRMNFKNLTIGNISAITYSNSFTTFNVRRSDFNSSFNGESDTIYVYNDKQYNQSIRFGALFNWAVRFNDNNIIELKNLYNQNSTDQYVSRSGYNQESNVHLANGAFDKVYRGIYSGQLTGKHELFDHKTTVEWMAGHNRSNRDQPDYKRYRSDVDITNGSRSLFVPVSAAQPEFLGRFFSELNEDSYSGSVSLKQMVSIKEDPLMNPTVKVGGFFETKHREFNARNIGFVRGNSFDISLQDGTIEELFAPENINGTTGIELDEETKPNDSYKADNKLYAAYAMIGLPITKKINVDFGMRMESNNLHFMSRKLDGTIIDETYPVTRYLPSVNATYAITEKSLIRAAYGETLNRPEFRELAPFSFYDFAYNYTLTGNEFLKTAKVQNFDLRWEMYPSKQELITVGLFYKLFEDPIEAVNTGSGSLGSKSFSYKNAESAVSYGVEVEIKKSLSGLTSSKVVDKLSALLNASLIKSEIELGDFAAGQSNKRPLQGQAPYIINAGLFYTDDETGLQVNALYNIVGKSIMFVGFEGYPDWYIMPRGILDLSVSKRFGEHFELRGGISDLLNQEFMILQDGNEDDDFDRDADQVIQKYKPGSVYSLGFSYKF